MLTLQAVWALAKKAPLWVWELVIVVVAVVAFLYAFAAKQRQIGAEQQAAIALRAQVAVLQQQQDSQATVTQAALAQRDSATHDLTVSLKALDSAHQAIGVLRAKIAGVTATTPDTVRVTVQAGYVKACDLIVASCDSVRAKAIRDSVASHNAIASLQNQLATAQRQLAIVSAPAIASGVLADTKSCGSSHWARDGTIGGLLGAAAALWASHR